MSKQFGWKIPESILHGTNGQFVVVHDSKGAVTEIMVEVVR